MLFNGQQSFHIYFIVCLRSAAENDSILDLHVCSITAAEMRMNSAADAQDPIFVFIMKRSECVLKWETH